MGCTQNKSLYLVMGLENKKLAHFMEGMVKEVSPERILKAPCLLP